MTTKLFLSLLLIVKLEIFVSGKVTTRVNKSNDTDLLLTGEKCLLHRDCHLAYTECLDGKCVCLHGFTFSNRTCTPNSYRCPFGEPIKINEQPVKCKRIPADSANNKIPTPFRPVLSQVPWTDDCANGTFCLLNDQLSSPTGVGVGQCCPTPNPACPFGEPLPTAICPPHLSGAICPYATHLCTPLTFGTQVILISCCPRPCAEGELHIDGKCWPKVRNEEECRYSAQCVTNAECLEGKCQCGKGYLDNGFGYSSCYKPNCPGGPKSADVVLDSKGRPMKCQSENATCPSNSYCNSNGKFCCPTPAPYCQNVDKYVSMNDRCQLNVPNQCGPDRTCNHWFTAALEITGHMTQQFGLCCPKS